VSTTDRDRKIAMYAEGYDALLNAFHEAPPEALKWKPTSADWSIHEVVIHCADAEMYAAIRLRLLATEERPTILAWDQDHWALALGYHRLPIEPALHAIEGVRGTTHALLQSLDAAVWERVGQHTATRAYTADTWLDIYHDHLHVHAAQIRDNIAHWWEGAGQ
jgi:hypothetical protein